MKRTLLLLTQLCVSAMLLAQQPSVPAARGNYPLAARFAPKKIEKLVFSTSVQPHWLKKSDRFWYVYETSEGKKWWIVDPAKKSRQALFNNAKMAADITLLVKDPFDAQHLPIEEIRFTEDENSFRFEVKSTEEVLKKDTSTKKDSTAKAKAPEKENRIFYFEYNLLTGKLLELKDQEKRKPRPGWAAISPDKRHVLFSRNHNLYWMDSANYRKALLNEDDSTIVEHQLTTDGVEDFAYGDNYNETNVEQEKNKKKRKPCYPYWSPDSRHFALIRTDERKVKDLWVIHYTEDPRPALETYKYQMPGEAEAPVDELVVFNFEAKTQKVIPVQQFKDQELNVWRTPGLQKNRDDDYNPGYWLGGNNKFYFSRTSRDLKKVELCQLDLASYTVKMLIREELNTYVETRPPSLVNEGKELVQWSERTGWGHFYLYDEQGNLKNAITSGAFHCEEVLGLDAATRSLFFTANAREAGEDPYYQHLYRVSLDGSGLTLLNAGNFDHQLSLNDNQRYFVNNASRVNAGPQSTLVDRNGKKLLDLETADLHLLFAAGYKYPQPFQVKADDGITDLYGVLYKPFDFDSTRKYPIITYVYPGPQTEAVNKSWGRSMDRIDRLAQLGFIVVTIGNRGGHPGRSKWYHNYGYGNLRDYGLADKKAAIEQLADRYSYIDINRVGIHGHSGGGFMSTAAMLVYPDFFKVAVSSAGNHENQIYNRWWSEKHHGVKEEISEKGDTSFVYDIEKNTTLAKNLKGHLFLLTGDEDNNVHPANTIRMAKALIKANKRFDFMIMPGQRHGFGDMTEYFFWLMADYYCKYLLDDFSQPVEMLEMNREVEQRKR
ncbi:MAG: DPP IV N-terminal domain-containing protein [Candidatus Pseudobacter hemicellulosilyticus]|uniref:DPP IV N-terminal domain-containing protein n=1 Tax=Candidatus Pseudobacter hemicellulosilyticus TaxID=3121375 RepID=A0AAJ5WTF2_9BACT|nr:MAG: DPP IV N-terminal domain-containing protein [Pseudobacter sp.]